MQRHYYEVSFASRFALDDSEIEELEQLIVDFLTPENDWETVNVNFVDGEGYGD